MEDIKNQWSYAHILRIKTFLSSLKGGYRFSEKYVASSFRVEACDLSEDS
jgi:hypothetical protein